MSCNVISWPGPAGEVPSPDYSVEVDQQPIFVYQARVRAEILQNQGLWSHLPDAAGERAAFAIFDMSGPVVVRVRVLRPFRTATVLPSRAGIDVIVTGDIVSFTLSEPCHLSLLLDDSDQMPLHLFVAEPEKNIPQPDDPDVLYFGPGVHEIETLSLQSGQTLYLAGGALLKARLPQGYQGEFSEQWKVVFYHGRVVEVKDATGVRICGRGILDASAIPHPGRPMIVFDGTADAQLSGITLRDAANWNVIIDHSRQIEVNDVRIISGRLNSDGINSVNAQQVQIHHCFVRNHDDSIAVKTIVPNLPAENILVENCTIWNDWGYALGATYETRAPIRNITYRCCDILFARHWCLGVHVSDSATISNISFHDIRIADLSRVDADGTSYAVCSPQPMLLKMVITADVWGKDGERGHIHDIVVDGVTLERDAWYASHLEGADSDHAIEGVTLRNIRLQGQPAVSKAADMCLTMNEFVCGVTVESDIIPDPLC